MMVVFLVLIILFQFHKGTIKTALRLSLDYSPDIHFNSIKVRLKLAYEYYSSISKITFQFHKGTIKTYISYSKPVGGINLVHT